MTEVESVNKRKFSETSVDDITTYTARFFQQEKMDDDRFFAVTFDGDKIRFQGNLRPNLSDFKIEWRNYAKHGSIKGTSNELLAIGRPLIACCCDGSLERSAPFLKLDN